MSTLRKWGQRGLLENRLQLVISRCVREVLMRNRQILVEGPRLLLLCQTPPKLYALYVLCKNGLTREVVDPGVHLGVNILERVFQRRQKDFGIHNLLCPLLRKI